MLDFAEAAEILDLTEDVDIRRVPRFLHREHLVLVGVFKQIEAKLDSLAAFTSRYSRLQQKDEDSDDDDVDLSYLDVKERFPALIKWDKAKRVRSQKRGLNHLVKYYRIGKDIVKHPKRLRWTGFDESSFLAKVKDLTSYNDFLHELLEGDYLKRLHENTRKTRLEMALVRKDMQDIRALLLAAATNPTADKEKSYELESLARTRQLVALNDATNNDRSGTADDETGVMKLDFTTINFHTSIPSLDEISHSRPRTLITLKHIETSGTDTTAFVEWKTYLAADDPKTGKLKPNADNLQRVQGLVSQLKSSRVGWSGIANCLGFFDLRDHSRGPELPCLFGLVYEITKLADPEKLSMAQVPKSLDSMLGMDCPSLSQRTKLAYHISRSVLYFNSVRWYHKSLRSDAITFPTGDDGKTDISKPSLTGFEYSRSGDQTGSTTHTPNIPEHNMYVHPEYQEYKGHYVRDYDIYSLGIILIEIAHWRSIRDLLASEFKLRIEPQEVSDILLSKNQSYLAAIRNLCGDHYYDAVYGCIKGLVDQGEEEDDITFSFRLQQAFVDGVVGRLAKLQDL